MFQINDLVFYGSAGVCKVLDIRKPPKGYPVGEGQLYYCLKPLYDSGEIFTPVDTRVFMRSVISKGEAMALAEQASVMPVDSFSSNKRMELMEHFRGMLNSHDCRTLLCLIKTLHARAQQSIHLGRNPSAMEQDLKKRAEGLLYGEMAVALGKSVEQVEEGMLPRIQQDPQLAQMA